MNLNSKNRRDILKIGAVLPAGVVLAGSSSVAVADNQQTGRSIRLHPPAKGLATNHIQQAVDDLSRLGGGTLILSAGRYTTGTVFLKSHVHIHLEQGAHWLASANIKDFVTQTWGHNKDRQPWHLISAHGEQNIAITGTGTIDGGGENYWQDYERNVDGSMKVPRWIKAKDQKLSPLIDINNSQHIVLRDITVHTGGGWCIHCFDCDDIQIDGVRIINNIYSPNSDGIDLTGCHDVSISNCHIKTCDDAIVLKTLEDSRTTERVSVSNCVIETLCVGIKMGAGESNRDMRDFSATNCVFNGTSRFFALYSKRGGMLENITISNITGNTNAKLVFNRPIQLMVERDHLGVIGGIRNVVVSNMHCHTDGRLMMTCDEGGVLDNITLRDVTLSYPWVEDPKAIVEGSRSNQFPKNDRHGEANGQRAAIVVHRATRIALYNVVVNWPKGEVPELWRHPERIENGTTRIHRYDYKQAQSVAFAFMWAKQVEGLVVECPFAIDSPTVTA